MGDHGSLVVKVMNSCLLCHDFEGIASEILPSRGDQCTLFCSTKYRIGRTGPHLEEPMELETVSERNKCETILFPIRNGKDLSPYNAHLFAFSQRSSSSHLIEDEAFNEGDIINNLVDYEDGQEEPDSLRVDKNMQSVPAFQQIGKAFSCNRDQLRRGK
ncbi:hypothetical protein TNCV_1651131 [Trichonephila clavipes]|nr:hypothetical protein TNCV_1651131 [Trichonephila clavipes]